MVDNEQSKNLSEIQAQWVTVRGRIRQKIGDAQFKSWIKMIVLQDYDDHKVILSVPSNFIRTRIIEQYLDIIKSYWLIQNLQINDIQIIVSEDSGNADTITVTLTSGSDVFSLFKTKSISANATTELLTAPLVVTAGEIIKVTAATANRLHVVASILELT